jgi:hypothetical protein
MPNNIKKLTTRTVHTARRAEEFRLKTLSTELWWSDTDRGKAGGKVSYCHLVHRNPTWTYLNAQFPVSANGHQHQNFVGVAGAGGGGEHCDKDSDKRHTPNWIRISKTEGILSYKLRGSPSYGHKCEKVKRKWQGDIKASNCVSRPVWKRNSWKRLFIRITQTWCDMLARTCVPDTRRAAETAIKPAGWAMWTARDSAAVAALRKTGSVRLAGRTEQDRTVAK